MPSLTDINNFFAGRKNQYERNIYQRNWLTNPYVSHFPRSEFDLEQGRIPEVITTTHELPTAYPFGLSNVTLSSGTGNPACAVPATTIKSGNKKRSYQLEQAAFDTEVICLTDMQFAYQAEQQVMNKERGLNEYGTVFMADWYRVHNIGMLDHKATITGDTSIAEKSDSLYDFSTLTIPSDFFGWEHAEYFYERMVAIGAGAFAVGQADGDPVFSLNCGPGYKRALFQRDGLVHETVNYGDAMQNFKARGINRAVGGFIPNVDLFPIRYRNNAGTLVPIYPFINQDTTNGRESVPNPNYRSVERGGQAEFEVITILTKGIYEVRPRPVGPLAFGQEKFNATNYNGSVNWINNKTFGGANDLGNLGYYRMDFQLAAKPVYPEFGWSVLAKALDV